MKLKYFSLFFVFLCGTANLFAQHSINIEAVVNSTNKTIRIAQEVNYKNNSNKTLTELYFHDWNNSFKSPESPLGQRFSEDFIRRFHFSKQEDRGATVINAVQNNEGENLVWNRPFMAPDILSIQLEKPLASGEEITLSLNYDLIIPTDRFTGYGYTNEGNFKLRYWFITPAVFDNQWHTYSNKNLNDLFVPKLKIEVKLQLPHEFEAITSLNKKEEEEKHQNYKVVSFSGKDVVDTQLYLLKNHNFEQIATRKISLLTNIETDLNDEMKLLTVARIFQFLKNRLGAYPHEKIMLSQEEYKNNPVYGLNQLPQFIRPFPDGFQYDIKILKTLTNSYLQNTILLNPRKDKWVKDAIHIALLIDYVEKYYPNMKILGSLSDFYGLKWTHASTLEFNAQYPLLYLHMARQNIDQPLTTPQDSLIKFNKNIGNAYKAGTGMVYLSHFIGKESIAKAIKEFYRRNLLELTEPHDFEAILKKNTSKDINWFFKDYVDSNSKIDFKIKKVKVEGDSLKVEIVNKYNNNMPVLLYGINNGRTVYKIWVENINPSKTVSIPKAGIERLGLNYELIIPEVNARNNYKGINSLLNKPIQFRLLKDVEDPRYSQVFFMPDFGYNLYDGAYIGVGMYNKTFLKRNFNYDISPKWGFNSETLVGSASIYQNFQFQDKNLFGINLGISGSRFSYGYGLFYQTFTPFLSLDFRNKNLRDNERQTLKISNVNVYRDTNEGTILEEPNYNVLSLEYNYSKPSLVHYLTSNAEFQVAKGFSKLSFSFDYRRLFPKNRHINLRMFAGVFLYNQKTDSDYFSFALDRPTDYLFEYDYYGRSESSGFFSQQIIMAEGGFKSQLQPEFANQWITTVNASTNIWNWIYVYGDAGLVKNKNFDAKFLYDSGIRLSLIEDYFEIFFPVYSSLGWEIGAEDYDQRIRFIATLNFSTLSDLFSRRWY